MTDPHELLHLGVEAAHAAGALLLQGRDGDRSAVASKSSLTDMVTEMDRASEDLIARTVLAARPGDAFLAEEGTAGAGTTGVRWVVDPLDGTTNYLYGFPSWAVSVAAETDGRAVAGVVHDPVHGETFTAVRGRGAHCNGRLLRVEGPAELSTALVGTGFSYDAATRGEQAAQLAGIIPAVRDVRRAGAASLDLCWVGLGRLDLYYERGLQPWDWAAGALVATEAGAALLTLEDGTLVAGPPRLHDAFVALVRSARAEGPAGITPA
ncbi:MAG: inositol monophosphatase [Actinomycetota bacterium]|nr:inositol monophosphatase [Actinomycetota bacterium]